MHRDETVGGEMKEPDAGGGCVDGGGVGGGWRAPDDASPDTQLGAWEGKRRVNGEQAG